MGCKWFGFSDNPEAGTFSDLFQTVSNSAPMADLTIHCDAFSVTAQTQFTADPLAPNSAVAFTASAVLESCTVFGFSDTDNARGFSDLFDATVRSAPMADTTVTCSGLQYAVYRSEAVSYPIQSELTAKPLAEKPEAVDYSAQTQFTADPLAYKPEAVDYSAQSHFTTDPLAYKPEAVDYSAQTQFTADPRANRWLDAQVGLEPVFEADVTLGAPLQAGASLGPTQAMDAVTLLPVYSVVSTPQVSPSRTADTINAEPY